MHAVVARSTCPGENVQNTSVSDHFWKLRCRKSAHRCGAKHMSKSKCRKHTAPDHFWKLRCRKSVRRCGAKHMSKSKVEKTEGFGALLGRSDIVVRGMHKGFCTFPKVEKTEGCGSFKYNRYTTLHYTTLRYTALQLQLQLQHYTPTTSTTTTTTTTATTTTLRYATLH